MGLRHVELAELFVEPGQFDFGGGQRWVPFADQPSSNRKASSLRPFSASNTASPRWQSRWLASRSRHWLYRLRPGQVFRAMVELAQLMVGRGQVVIAVGVVRIGVDRLLEALHGALIDPCWYIVTPSTFRPCEIRVQPGRQADNKTRVATQRRLANSVSVQIRHWVKHEGSLSFRQIREKRRENSGESAPLQCQKRATFDPRILVGTKTNPAIDAPRLFRYNPPAFPSSFPRFRADGRSPWMDLLIRRTSSSPMWSGRCRPARGSPPGALLAVVVASLAYLCNHSIVGGEAYLLQGHQFTTSEIEAAQAALGEAGLNDYEIEGNQIRVPRR